MMLIVHLFHLVFPQRRQSTWRIRVYRIKLAPGEARLGESQGKYSLDHFRLAVCALCACLSFHCLLVLPLHYYHHHQTEFEQPNQSAQPESEHPDTSQDASEPHEPAYETEEEHPGYQPNVYNH